MNILALLKIFLRDLLVELIYKMIVVERPLHFEVDYHIAFYLLENESPKNPAVSRNTIFEGKIIHNMPYII